MRTPSKRMNQLSSSDASPKKRTLADNYYVKKTRNPIKHTNNRGKRN
jgi:hypothetical protein